MAKETLEGVVLKPASISVNPEELKKFDELVGVDQRSKVIRDLIRDYLRAAGICNEDILSSTERA
jgi:metal-responsive CopG/Arc/MetJ family transcriptional regulator